jgi:hypothetical protein
METKTDTFKWRIVKDYITPQEERDQGKTWVGYGVCSADDILMTRFRLYDDDHTLYLEGLCNDINHEDVLSPCDYFKWRIGTTEMKYYKAKKG